MRKSIKENWLLSIPLVFFGKKVIITRCLIPITYTDLLQDQSISVRGPPSPFPPTLSLRSEERPRIYILIKKKIFNCKNKNFNQLVVPYDVET